MFDISNLPVKTLSAYAHKAGSNEMCAMEAVAWLAGEEHSDAPKCACPTISRFMRSWNDGLEDEDRTRVIGPLLLDILDTANGKSWEREMMARDWVNKWKKLWTKARIKYADNPADMNYSQASFLTHYSGSYAALSAAEPGVHMPNLLVAQHRAEYTLSLNKYIRIVEKQHRSAIQLVRDMCALGRDEGHVPVVRARVADHA